MNKAEKLKKDYERKLTFLQNNCKHKRLSDWIPCISISGGRTSRLVRICSNCNKEMDTSISTLTTAATTTTTNATGTADWIFSKVAK